MLGETRSSDVPTGLLKYISVQYVGAPDVLRYAGGRILLLSCCMCLKPFCISPLVFFKTPKLGTIFTLGENILASSLAQGSFLLTLTPTLSTFINPPKAPQLNLPCTFRLMSTSTPLSAIHSCIICNYAPLLSAILHLPKRIILSTSKALAPLSMKTTSIHFSEKYI